jgi:AraC-like DNA-binding protein
VEQHAEHHEHTPSARLAPWVERAVGYRFAGFPAGVHVGMPSGSVTLVITLDGPLTIADPGRPAETYGSVLAGLSATPSLIHHDGNQHGVQLALRPAGVRALFGCPAAELAAASYELVDVMGTAAGRLRERLHETDAWEHRFALVEEALSARERDRSEPHPEVAEAWRLIAVSGGTVRIRDVAREVGWSMRHLQGRFRAEYGLTPKAAARVRRFERSVDLVASARVPLSEVAHRCGWTDQAHMDRDWRELAGTSPTRWRSEDVLASV